MRPVPFMAPIHTGGAAPMQRMSVVAHGLRALPSVRRT
jgi:hypothetical protein